MPKLETVHDYFLQQVQHSPEETALIYKNLSLSYKELDHLSNRIARYLLDNGVVAGSLVPICLYDPVCMVAGILGIIKAGAAYVPLDPDLPVARLQYMVEDTAARIVISETGCEKMRHIAGDHQLLHADHNWSVANSYPSTPVSGSPGKDTLVYVIYTSGSTGVPKGVQIKHSSLAHYLDGLYESLPEKNYRSYGLGSTFAADAIIPYLFGSLTRGGTLHLFSKDDYNDIEYLHSYLDTHRIECFSMFPSQWKSMTLNGAELLPEKLMMLGGETLYSEMVKKVLADPENQCVLINHYGPTETTVAQLMHRIDPSVEYGVTIPIGKPFTGADIYIADEHGYEVPEGTTGELYIGGPCVAAGYLHQPGITEQRFVKNPFKKNDEILYRTGDLVRMLPDGNIEFLGRIDDQVKIRGYRIELGEVENALLQTPGIKQAVVLANEAANGEKRLVAYIVCDGPFNKKSIEQHLELNLPENFIPRIIMPLNRFPLMPNGKVDKKALPNPDASNLLNNPYLAPQTETEMAIAAIWKNLLGTNRVGIDDNFFELGGNSLLALRAVSTLKAELGINIPVVKLYQYPKIKELVQYLTDQPQKNKQKRKISAGSDDIAVIAMSGRFPGAGTIEDLWEVLKEGRETTTFFTNDELDPGIPDSVKNDPGYVSARGLVEGVKEFDAGFFGITPAQAELMDPQQRIFLEIAWEALEKSGYTAGASNESIGVFAGVQPNTYFTNNVLSHPDKVAAAGPMQIQILNDKDFVASRTAYALDLKGPAINVQSACSTSLVAVAQAVESIRRGQCDLALAGGASITVPLKSGHLYEEGAILSDDGHCRPFDANAKGTVFSDGAGVVLLKRLEDAKEDGDHIYAIIKGVGLSNDGGGKGSFSAPNAEGQSEAISMAISDAGISPGQISYIEAHGTATPLGDPIEIEGLKMAFGEQPDHQYCALGSVKGNFGHLAVSAGIAGFIKTCLALQHKQIPASINYERSNPHINFSESPFFVNTELREWKSEKTRYAGVSSFGVGGTNAHIVLCEAEEVKSKTERSHGPQLLRWSAGTEKSLLLYRKKLAAYLKQNKDVALSDVAGSLYLTKKHFDYREYIIASDISEAIAALETGLTTPKKKIDTNHTGQTVLLFPGQGDQYLNMARSLYDEEPVFRTAMDECAALLKPELNEDILAVIYPEQVDAAAEEKLKKTRYSQPALFSVCYSLGKLWMSYGITPGAMAGHSVGEFVSACLAGVFTLPDALRLIAARGSMMDDLPAGSMLSVRLPLEKLEPYLNADIDIAAVNSPQLCVLAGDKTAIEQLSKKLDAAGVANKILPTSHAFHSRMVDGAISSFKEVVKTIKLSRPSIPIMSTVTGEWLSEDDATDPEYWARHMRQPVMFGKAIEKLLNSSYSHFLEVGPGKSVATMARQQAAGRAISAVSPLENETVTDRLSNVVLNTFGELFVKGWETDRSRIPGSAQKSARLHNLPTYAFDKQTYWLEPAAKTAQGNVNHQSLQETTVTEQTLPHRLQFANSLKELLETASGIDMSAAAPGTSFIELGLDSLLLTQVALQIKKHFGIPVSFRQLNEELKSISQLAEYLESQVPGAENKSKSPVPVTEKSELPEAIEANHKPFGAMANIDRSETKAKKCQQDYIDALTELYCTKTKGSKEYTQHHRAHMADPRVVSGFRPATKELTYPIVIKKSKGSRIWDLDGNEYIDALNGFGSNMLGYQPDVLKDALLAQVEKGYEIGPQHELAGDVCKLICEATGFDRSGLCNTGSEAVLGAMRIARTVTGKSLIVTFTGSYHGIIDEVIVRGGKKLKAYPAAPGILPEAVQNMLVLEYGTEESLRIIEERADEIAAVLVEPLQSRRPDFQPISFLKKLRHITTATSTVLIFDEVVSGFRFHPGGIQGLWGIKADIATYGKVIGGGLSIGVIAGKKQFMDALDGGWWQYGDDSAPEAGVTYFAGTFVRHPLALATTKASLEYLKKEGGQLQEKLNANGRYISRKINSICRELQVPIKVLNFGSLWRIKLLEEFAYSELLYILMRLKGIHMLEGFPCYLTTAQTASDLELIADCFGEAVKELKDAGFIPHYEHEDTEKTNRMEQPPVPFAKLGKDKDGNPAWFISDEQNPGKFLQIINELQECYA